MYTLLTNKSITNGLYYGPRTYSIINNKIGSIKTAEDSAASPNNSQTIIDLRSLTVLPGLIDIHTHGCIGFDVMNATPEEINKISIHKLKEGVTSFFPSTVTAPLDATAQAIRNIKQAMNNGLSGANILGVLLEGPYMNPIYKGAHVEEYIQSIICLDELIAFVKNTKQIIPGGNISITLAPELPNAIEAITTLSAMGINCCLGHSAATFEEAKAGVEAGAKIATHTYNAMSPLQHRSPGMVGAILTLDNIFAEIICDLVHVHPAAIKLAVKAKGPEGIVLVTDAAAPAGLPDGEYTLGEIQITKTNGIARTPEGALASSSIGLIDCVRNMHKTVGIPLADAVTMATASPARAVGQYATHGSLEENKTADIIAIDDDFNVKFVMVDGIIKHKE